MANSIRNFRQEPIKDENTALYRRIVEDLVKDLMKQVEEKDNMFSDYKILLSGSTKEDVRVGNPYEIDYMIQYDIGVESIFEVPQYPGFVWITPNLQTKTKFETVMERGVLSCDKLMFHFFKIVFDITHGTKYESQGKRLRLGIGYKDRGRLSRIIVNERNFRRITSIGAAIPFDVLIPAEYDVGKFSNPCETIDVVLSFHCHGYWPKLADHWKLRYEKTLKEECFDSITEYGASMVCKVPVEDTTLFENTPVMFRLSFSFAESKLFEFVTPEQKEAYKLLKHLRETNLTNYMLMDVLLIGDLLKKRFMSYHMKSVFFTLTTGVYKDDGVREWLILFLKKIIICLQNESIKHHFMTDLELLVNTSMEDELQKNFQYNLMQKEIITFDDFKKSLPAELKDVNGEIRTCKIIENVFKDILETLPKDLSELHSASMYKDTLYLLPPPPTRATCLI